MTQIAIIQAAPQSPSTSTTFPGDKPNNFFPHLEKAVTETTPDTSNGKNENFPPAVNPSLIDSPHPEVTDQLLDTRHLTDITLEMTADHTERDFVETLTTADPPDMDNQKNLPWHSSGQEITAQPAKQRASLQPPGLEIAGQHARHGLTLQPPGQELAAQHARHESTRQSDSRQISTEAVGKEFPVSPQGEKSGELFVQSISSTPGSKKSSVIFSPLTTVETIDTPLKIDITAATTQNKNNPLPQVAQSQSVLQQLQQIINNANETGTVSIQGTVNSYSLQNYGGAGTKPGGIISNQIFEHGKIAEKPGSQVPTLRQDMLAQYFDARVNAGEPGDSGQNSQSSDQQNSATNQQTSTTPQVNPSLSPDQAGSFQQLSTLMQDMQTSQTQNSAKPVILPSGTIVNEDNVLQQIVDRFQINSRSNDTKISLKLHPEELGELKIDLTLKEGSIKANVIAHNQHVLEIIEKNIAKLRNTLEDQGFTIEEIVVTSESDSVPDFDLFEEHLSRQKDFSPATTESVNHNEFDIALEDAVEHSVELSTGVNIQA